MRAMVSKRYRSSIPTAIAYSGGLKVAQVTVFYRDRPRVTLCCCHGRLSYVKRVKSLAFLTRLGRPWTRIVRHETWLHSRASGWRRPKIINSGRQS